MKALNNLICVCKKEKELPFNPNVYNYSCLFVVCVSLWFDDDVLWSVDNPWCNRMTFGVDPDTHIDSLEQAENITIEGTSKWSCKLIITGKHLTLTQCCCWLYYIFLYSILYCCNNSELLTQYVCIWNCRHIYWCTQTAYLTSTFYTLLYILSVDWLIDLRY